MAQDEKQLSLDTPLTSLAPGDYRIELKAKNAALAWLLRWLARDSTFGVWDKHIIPHFENQSPKVKMPRSNFIGKTFRPRKGFDDKDKTFWFWIKVVK